MSDHRLRSFLRARLTPWDVVGHGAVALVLLLAYAASIPYEAFVYRPGVSGLEAAYWSLLGHATPIHLLGNVTGYLVLSGLSLCLLGVSSRRLYYAVVVSLFVAVPPLSGVAVELSLERTAPAMIGTYRGAGFSLFTAALVGLLAVAIAVHQADRLDSSVPPGLSSVGFLAIGIAVPSLRYDGPLAVSVVFGLLGLTAVAYAAALVRVALQRESATLEAALSMVAVITFVGAVSDLFPSQPGIVGVTSHFVGLVCGFVVVWVVLVVRSAVTTPSRRSG